jgi:ferrous iron transport protein B
MSAAPLPRIAVVGNPNTGKSTLFNALTGLRQRVGNYPGVTVARKSGTCDLGGGRLVELIDLPGLYSLAAVSPDERLVIDVLLGRLAGEAPPDLVLVVCDATNLLRNCFLAAQIAELGLPAVIAVNQSDVARERGIEIDAPLLGDRLGTAVALVSAWKGEGIADVRRALLRGLDQRPLIRRSEWPAAIAAALEEVAAVARDATGRDVPPALAQRFLFDAAPTLAESAGWAAPSREPVLRAARDRVRRAGLNPPAAEPLIHYARLRRDLEGVVRGAGRESRSAAVDRLLLHRFLGPVCFAAFMLGLFWSVFALAKPPMEWILAGVDALKSLVAPSLETMPMVQSLVTDGILGGVGAFLVFLPQIAILFLLVGLLEDSGYMARAAFIMDRMFGWCGLNGKSFVPLLSGFACAIPGILSTRTIEDPKARLATAFAVPFMSCSARFPVYALMCAAFIGPQHGALWESVAMVGMHLVGLLFAVPTAFILTRVVLRVRPAPFVLELPRYQLPKLKDVLWRVWQSVWEFIQKAGTIIFALTIVVWALSYFPRDEALADRARVAAVAKGADADAAEAAAAAAQVENSWMGRMGKTIQPVFDPAGFDWKLTVGVLASFPAREVIVSTLGITYALGEETGADSESLYGAMREARWTEGPRAGTPIFTLPTVLALMVFFALCSQCGSTVVTLARETGGWKWAGLSFGYMTALAWLAAVVVYQVGTALMS